MNKTYFRERVKAARYDQLCKIASCIGILLGMLIFLGCGVIR